MYCTLYSNLLDTCRRIGYLLNIKHCILYCKLLQHCKVITDEDIVESLNGRNESETDSHEDDENATNTKLSTAAKAFDVPQTLLKWVETQDEIDCIQLMNLKRLEPLAARKRGIGLKW